jgi:hypothetical protein
MGSLECSKSIHALFEHIFLHVQVHVYDMVMSMVVEKGFKSFSKIFWRLEPKFNHVFLLQCLPIFCYASMEVVWIFWWPFLSPHGTKYKHQKRKSKNACLVAMSNELMAIQVNGISKACWTLAWKSYEIWWYE